MSAPLDEGLTTRTKCFACGEVGREVGRFRYLPDQAGFVPAAFMDTWCRHAQVLMRCPSCGCQWPSSMPSAGLLRAWYGAQVYSAGDARSSGHEAAEAILAGWTAGDVVDVGCGAGVFLDITKGWRAFGLEPSAAARSRAAELGRCVCPPDDSGWADALPEKVDVITLFDVVEHLAEARASLALLAGHLKPGGRLVIFTGDAGSPWARAWGARWWYHGWAGHISCFSRRGLSAMLRDLGCRRIRSRTLRYALVGEGFRGAARHFARSLRATLRDFIGPRAPLAASPLGPDHMLVVAQF